MFYGEIKSEHWIATDIVINNTHNSHIINIMSYVKTIKQICVKIKRHFHDRGKFSAIFFIISHRNVCLVTKILIIIHSHIWVFLMSLYCCYRCWCFCVVRLGAKFIFIISFFCSSLFKTTFCCRLYIFFY